MFYLVIEPVFVKGEVAYERSHYYKTTPLDVPLTDQHVCVDLKWMEKVCLIYIVNANHTCIPIKEDKWDVKYK